MSSLNKYVELHNNFEISHNTLNRKCSTFGIVISIFLLLILRRIAVNTFVCAINTAVNKSSK